LPSLVAAHPAPPGPTEALSYSSKGAAAAAAAAGLDGQAVAEGALAALVVKPSLIGSVEAVERIVQRSRQQGANGVSLDHQISIPHAQY